MTELGGGSFDDKLMASIAEQLAALEQSGAKHFEPVRFCYIESMARRALEQKKSRGLIVENKVLKALSDFQVDFSQARGQAAMIVARLAARFPESIETIDQLFEAGDFKELTGFEARLERKKNRKKHSLVALTQQINGQGESFAANQQGCSFADKLQQQEKEVVQSLADLNLGFTENSVRVGHHEAAGARELKSVRLFRESWAKLSYEKLVTRAIREAPENPGPLNPQMLVIRSLSTMRDLSPEYLNRFVSYIDTLLWLEQADGKAKPAKSKKTGRKTKS